MTENIKLHCDKDGYVYKGEPIIINNISDNIVYKIKKMKSLFMVMQKMNIILKLLD